MHHQCVALLAANSLYSGLSRASSIAYSKVKLCRDRSFFKVAIHEVYGHPTDLLQSLWGTAVRILLAVGLPDWHWEKLIANTLVKRLYKWHNNTTCRQTWLSTSIAMSMNMSWSSLIDFSNFIMSLCRASISFSDCFACWVSVMIWTWPHKTITNTQTVWQQSQQFLDQFWAENLLNKFYQKNLSKNSLILKSNSC